jgi:hypothetical protein
LITLGTDVAHTGNLEMPFMHKPLNYDIRYRLVFLWLLINTCLAVIIASLISIGMDESFTDLFIISLLATQIVAFLATGAGYACGYLLHDYPLAVIIPANLIVTLTASYCGIHIALLAGNLLKSVINYDLMNVLMDKLMVPVLIITAMVSILTVCIEYFKYKRMLLLGSLNELQNKITHIESLATGKFNFEFKVDNRPVKVNYNSIIFLWSAGKKSMIHTELRDYEVSQLLKDIEDSLPLENFIRIHKQYIVNIAYISRMKYYKGGRYLLYLDDEDENILPVGGKFTSKVRERIESTAK